MIFITFKMNNNLYKLENRSTLMVGDIHRYKKKRNYSDEGHGSQYVDVWPICNILSVILFANDWGKSNVISEVGDPVRAAAAVATVIPTVDIFILHNEEMIKSSSVEIHSETKSKCKWHECSHQC